jgi:hypothetical protein
VSSTVPLVDQQGLLADLRGTLVERQGLPAVPQGLLVD